jgi:hypothetical protein
MRFWMKLKGCVEVVQFAWGEVDGDMPDSQAEMHDALAHEVE